MLRLSPPTTTFSMTNSSASAGAIPEVSIICRNLTHKNGTKVTALPKDSADFGAVLYIIVVLTFYSLGIIIMIIKYLKTERKEMEEEMVLDSFFKGIPDKRIEFEKESVNRVAIQAFHTLTASRSPPVDEPAGMTGARVKNESLGNGNRHSRGTSRFTSPSYDGVRSTPDTSPSISPSSLRVSPSQYRRGRYSIQPTNIQSARQRANDGEWDKGDDYDDTITNVPEHMRSEENGHSSGTCVEESDHKDPATDSVDIISSRIGQGKKKAKHNKAVVFIDSVDSIDNNRSSVICDTDGKANTTTLSVLSQPYIFGSSKPNSEQEIPQIQLSCENLDNRFPVFSADTDYQKSSTMEFKPTADSDSQECKARTVIKSKPQKSVSPKKRKTSGRGFVTTRKRASEMYRPQDSPDLGNFIRISSLEKGTGDGSSYDSSSSLLTRIHLADPMTPPLKAKKSQFPYVDTELNKRDTAEIHYPPRSVPPLRQETYTAIPPSSSSYDSPGETTERVESNEKLKLTAGGLPMQPTYDSTASTAGRFTTRVNVTEAGDTTGDRKTCLVTDL